MTTVETGQIMAILKGAYPMFYKDMGQSEAKEIVKLWASMFADEDPKLVAAAVKALIATDEKGFPPHIGAVKAKIRQISQPKSMTEGEAWNLISRALSNGIYGAQDEFAKLPPILQKLVGSPNQLREWACMDAETVQSVVASNVQRAYRVVERRQQELTALPADVLAIADGISGKLALTSGENSEQKGT